MSESEAILELQSVSCTIGGVRAVIDVSLDVRTDEIVGVIGPNGAGKTTLFNVVTGFLPPDAGGEIKWLGESIVKRKPQQIALSGLTRTFQEGGGFSELTVYENLMLASRGKAPDRLDQIVADLKLGRFVYQKLADCSLATRKVVGIGMGIVRFPKLLLLDEPLAGLDVFDRDSVMHVIREVHQQGVSLVVIEHDIPRTLELVDRLVVLETGSIRAIDTPSKLRARPELLEVYLRN